MKAYLLAVLALCLFLGCAARISKAKNLGVSGGQLAPCPGSPNCVSSQADEEPRKVSPASLRGTPAEAMAIIVSLVEELPRTTLVTTTDYYLHAECRSALFRFVDDLEVFIDESESVIHFRSASRTGYSDFGVNRNRVEALKKALDEAVE